MNRNTHNWYCIFNVGNGNFTKGQPADETDIIFTLDWEVTDQDVVNGTSTIDWSMKVHLNGFEHSRAQLTAAAAAEWAKDATGIVIGNTGYPDSSFTDFTLRADVQDDSYLGSHSVSIASNDKLYLEVLIGETKTIDFGTCVIPHNPDGTLTLYFAGGLYVDRTFLPNTTPIPSGSVRWGYRGSFSTNYMTIDPIAKQGVIKTAPNFNDEQSPTVTYAMPKECTEAWVGIAIGGSTMTIPYRSVAVSSSSYTFNFTQSEKEAMWAILARGVHTAEARFYIKTTYDGQTLESYKVATLEVINFMPTLDPEVYDTVPDIIDRLTGNKYILVRYASKPYFSTGALAHKGATISTQSVKNGETTKYGASGTFDSVTSNLFTFAAVDNFGRSITSEMEFSKPNYFIDYVKLTASVSVTEMTADGDVAVTLKGKYFNGSFGKRNNSMRMHYEIAQNNGEPEFKDMGYIYPTVTGSDYSYTFTISGLDYLSVYDLTVRVSDEISVEPTEANVIVASTPIFDWGRQDFNFNVPVNIEGDLTVAGNITAGGNTVPTIQAQGTAGIWTYRTWSDGTAECWGKKDVSVTFPSSANWGGLYTTGAISASNVSFPFGLFAETPVVNASLLIRSVGGILMAPGGNDSNKATWDQTGIYEIARGAPVSDTQYYTINYDVKGRWK